MKTVYKSCLALLLVAAAAHAQRQPEPLLLQQPTMNQSEVVFVYAGDLWAVSRQGGAARRLTSGPGLKDHPKFSPDGRWIAFTGRYNGNANVYVMPAEGGQPRQLTFHPGPDVVVGWTPDSHHILFASPRAAFARGVMQLFTVPLEGGFAEPLPLPIAFEGSYSPDGAHIAYVPLPQPFGSWKHYRGGTRPVIWIADLADSSIRPIPQTDSIDYNPMWAGDHIYFISDRAGRFTLFDYDVRSGRISRLLDNRGYDVRSASLGPGGIVYEQFGSLHIFDLASRRDRTLSVSITGDFPELRPHFEKVAGHVLNAGISPTGARAVFEAHGEILTVPAEKGSVRNLTHSPGVADRDPAWSPDGRSIAYFSDESGEYQLYVVDQSGLGPVRKYALGNPPSFYYHPVWSPDSRKIAYTDKRLHLWYLDLDTGRNVLVDTDTYETPSPHLDPAWSPDSRWITYTKLLPNHMRAVFVYSLEAGKTTQVTDGMSDASYARFDRSGKYLFFMASTNAGPTTGWLDMSSFEHPVTRSVYVVVLRSDLPSPLAPESDDEKPAATTEHQPQTQPPAKPEPVRIDFENISQRILALPVPAANYLELAAGEAGQIYLLRGPEVFTVGRAAGGPPALDLIHFDLNRRKTETLLEGIQEFVLSADGKKFLYRQGKNWGIASTAQPVKPGTGLLRMDEMDVEVVPAEEWKQMYHEVWRIERDFLYDPHLHGLNLPRTEQEFSRFLPGIASREDLNYLFRYMLGEINVGHMFVAGGDMPEVPRTSVGLLGADFTVDHGHYRFARVYSGENWNPDLQAPLTAPGVNVHAGEYLFEVNGREVSPREDIYSYFLDTVGRQVVLKVGPNPDGTGARTVTVVPIASEAALRNRAWIEDNRRTVERLSQGRLAYVYLPDTAGGGYTNFNRYFFAQVDRQGAVIDERFNGGGTAADYIIQYLQRQLWNYWFTREGAIFTTPLDAIFGPKAMIINPFAGSGGDALPWYFRHVGLGPLVGETTWGGLVGIYNYPPLIDGGTVTAPRVAFFNTQGQWDVENHGVPPDIPVLLDPKAWRQGHDTQLEKAVEVVLEELKKHPPAKPHVPAFPDYSKTP